MHRPVAALLEGIGSGAVSNPVMDVTKAEVIVIIGANPTVNHPVAATWMKNAAKNGAKLIVMDPRKSDLTRLACLHVQFKPDTDVAMLNAMMHVIVHEGLVRRGLHRRAHHRLRRAEEEPGGLQPRGDGAGVRRPRPRRCAKWRACTPPPAAP
jgi:predicted molibdopterin-dependent oxidoreductase YjgC